MGQHSNVIEVLYLSFCLLKFNFCYIKIERVQNKRLYQSYLIYKDYIKKKNNQNENEKTLFHGTDENNINLICQNGLNRSYCGKNGFFF